MTLKTAVKERKVSEIRAIVKNTPIADIAETLDDLATVDKVVFFRLLKTDDQAEIFSRMTMDSQEDLISAYSDDQMKELMDDLYTQDIVDLIEEVPEELAKKIVKSVNKEKRSSVKKLLRYEDDDVGSRMHVDVVLLMRTLTVSKARKIIRDQREIAKLSHYYFVVGSKGRLKGYISSEDLLFEESTTKLEKIIKPIGYVKTITDIDDAALEFARQDLSVLPVVNSKDIVVGMLTADDVIDILQEQASEQVNRMTGISSDAEVSYSKQSAFKIFSSRIFWLLLLLIAATGSHFVITYFEGMLDHDIALGAIITTTIMASIPLIMDSAGNSGSQASATVIRALALGDITKSDFKKVMGKEFLVALYTGFALGIVNFVRLIVIQLVQGDFSSDTVILSAAISLALLMVIILSKTIGGALPLIAKWMKRDPAVMATPLLTTIIDTLSIIILFGVSIGIMLLV